MKKFVFLAIILAGIFFYRTERCQAQEKVTYVPGTVLQITLLDGSEISGSFVSQDDQTIVVESSSIGKITIDKSKIKSIRKISGENVKKGKVWFENPNPYRYLLGNSAIPKPSRMATYQNVWIFFNSFSYAPLKFMDITAGFELFSLLSKSKDAPYVFFLNPRMSTKVVKNLYAGGNVLYVNYFNHSDDDSASFRGLGVINGFVTYGTSNLNITGGLGWGFVNKEFQKKPVISVAGMARISRRIAFVSENWFVPVFNEDHDYYSIFSYGIRFLGGNNSIDLAFINNKDISKTIFLGIPFLDFVINF
jgi:hypothetical protein